MKIIGVTQGSNLKVHLHLAETVFPTHLVVGPAVVVAVISGGMGL